jgi:hypothetical protein
LVKLGCVFKEWQILDKHHVNHKGKIGLGIGDDHKASNVNRSPGLVMDRGSARGFSEDKNEGHVDTREANFECGKKDENLGCNVGIGVAG